jgi:hypothetical protein
VEEYMELEPRERERSNLKEALANFALILDVFEARVRTYLPTKAASPVEKPQARSFAIDVVAAIKGGLDQQQH